MNAFYIQIFIKYPGYICMQLHFYASNELEGSSYDCPHCCRHLKVHNCHGLHSRLSQYSVFSCIFDDMCRKSTQPYFS